MTEQLKFVDLDKVNGGMKWERGHKSQYVVDMRGGVFEFLGTTVTFDVSGRPSSITHT